jgi:polysaccharide export outer membrane protein
MTKAVAGVLLSMSVGLAGCSTPSEHFNLPQGQHAYQVIPPQRIEANQVAYRINPMDSLTITVFREPDLAVRDAPVEASGGLVLPLIGEVHAVGRTSTELAATIETELRKRGLRQPRVSVIIASTKSQNVVVDGAVQEAGVYQLLGSTTLLQSIAMAKGANRVAQLDRVAIFRTINGVRSGALFDVMAIREGRAPDPYIQSGDYVIVGSSSTKSRYYDVLSILPAFGLFIPLLVN